MHYHISAKDHGAKFEFTPKVPATAGPRECQVTERVCFSPTVWQCLIGVCGTSKFIAIAYELLYVALRDGTQPVVYQTRAKLTPPPKLVTDFKVTGEMWSLKPITCYRRGYVDLLHLITQRKIKIVQTQDAAISKDFYAGWEAARIGDGLDWKVKPPIDEPKQKLPVIKGEKKPPASVKLKNNV